MRFEIGAPYVAVPDILQKGRLIVVPIGRQGGSVQFAFVSDLKIGEVCMMNGDREFARIETDRGVYCVSSISKIDAEGHAEVEDMLRRARHEG